MTFPPSLARQTALALLGLYLGGPAAAGPAPMRATAQGVYSEAQAEKGRTLHAQHCAQCHQPDYYQDGFLDAWVQAPVSVLYDVIELKMPEDRPGSLKPREYAALLAFIFEINGLPAGDEPLSPRHDAMERIRITRKP